MHTRMSLDEYANSAVCNSELRALVPLTKQGIEFGIFVVATYLPGRIKIVFRARFAIVCDANRCS